MDAGVIRTLGEHIHSNSSTPSLSSATSRLPSAPARAVQRTYPGAPAPDNIELERLPTAASVMSKGSVPRATIGQEAPGMITPGLSRTSSSGDLESSRPASPFHVQVEAKQTWNNPYKNRFRVAACCIVNLFGGMIDGASGAIIPYMETHYNIKYGTVSLIFVGNAVGFIIAALLLDFLRHHLNRDKTLGLSQIIYFLALIPLTCAAPFPLLVFSFFFFGAGCAIYLAEANVYCGGLANGTSILGVMHGSYGIGATTAPLIATAMINSGISWNKYYFLPLGFAAFTSMYVPWAFWNHVDVEETNAVAEDEGPVPNKLLAMFRALRVRVVLLGALFIFCYQGAEVSISGWVISFLIKTRGGDPASVGYVTSGFWGGITVGRFLLSGPAHLVGEKRFVYGTVIGAAIMQALVWGVPHVVGDAVAVSVVGLLLGPVYPCSMAVMMSAMTRKEKLTGVGTITAFGSSGGAILPFLTGILAQAVGTWVLHPIVIVSFGIMMTVWLGVPAIKKRAE